MESLPTKPIPLPFSEPDNPGLRYGAVLDLASEALSLPAPMPTPLPDWITRPAPKDYPVEEMATPSGLLAKDERLTRPPGQGRFRRGVLVHRLLEVLPDYAEEKRADIARAILGKEPDLTEDQAQDIVDEVFGVLKNPEFDPIFKNGSRAEVSLAGRVKTIWSGEVFLTAQVDRIHVTPEGVFLVDYKSNRIVPADLDSVDEGYLAQMAAYRELARAIWPNKSVTCGLLWTRGPSLMWLPDPVMDAVLTQVNALPTSIRNANEGES